MGQQVRKKFPGYGWYNGKITAMDGAKYVVEFEDGTTQVHVLYLIIRTHGMREGGSPSAQCPDLPRLFGGGL